MTLLSWTFHSSIFQQKNNVMYQNEYLYFPLLSGRHFKALFYSWLVKKLQKFRNAEKIISPISHSASELFLSIHQNRNNY
jgi:hypothetical protein